MTDLTASEESEFERENEVADAIFTELLDETPDDIDVVAVAFGLWVSLTQFLAAAGWTGEELAKDLHHHVALGSTEGGMN